MNLMAVVRFIALLSTGLLAGIFWGWRMGASIAAPTIPVSSFVQFQQVVHTYYVRFMPVLQIAAVLSSLIWLLLLRSSAGSLQFVLLAVAAAGAIGVFVLTIKVNVPINKKLMTWNASAPPANVMEIWKPWEKVNTVRTIISIGVFGFELLSSSLMAQSQQIIT